jgi:hypothetical protein
MGAAPRFVPMESDSLSSDSDDRVGPEAISGENRFESADDSEADAKFALPGRKV